MKLNLKIYLFAFFIFAPSLMSAQEKRDSIGGYFFTVTPTSFLNLRSGLQAGVEVGINNFGLIEVEGTLFLKSLNQVNQNFDPGYKLSLHYKLPVFDKFIDKFVVSFHYIESNRTRAGQFDRFDGSFFQQLDYQQKRTIIGPTIGGATTIYCTKFFYLEFGARLGLGYLTINNLDIPSDARFLSTGVTFLDQSRDQKTSVSVMMGLHLKLMFGKTNINYKKS